ncbi:TetR/AcrR family transcriptional regulator [Albidovulum sediminicola]|uniref:TetR/AcrR family transcriptional regulator n=1 Tax=Albidovulum sediminicola TaxID=2984331 RepID=A0ABT2YY98_9RHOB|nr:TetR/AcrR family transcriptional regulator [Defluviimonas sp. WL0075]MCV2863770.1 TetR/AcrR family transcriptional regulator [Defluviimonas sp. WL0075]
MDDAHACDEDRKATGWRGSREGWLEAAKAAFLESGIEAVKIQPLASQLNLSRTSFYWFFKDRAAILDALLEHWDETNTAALVSACDAYAETITEAVLNLLSVFLDDTRFQPRLDFAIRGWAHQSDAVMARVAAADERRLAAIRGMFERFGLTGAEADVRARTVYLVQIGYISMQVTESLATRMARIPAYVKTYSGQTPSEREMARFQAGLGYQPEPR